MPGGKYHDYICHDQVFECKKAKIKGELYDLNVGYPSLILGEETWVIGFLLNFESNNILKKLDTLEGYSKRKPLEENQYNRGLVSVFDLKENLLCQAWTYFMEESQLSRFNYSIIESGVWINKKAN